uniref:BRO n=1 Tax=Cydia pomonella granulosis virus TaxID=28289 RepID=A0A5B8GPP8_GVCP|nr:BRO [Cydia pomonella granulovirus]
MFITEHGICDLVADKPEAKWKMIKFIYNKLSPKRQWPQLINRDRGCYYRRKNLNRRKENLLPLHNSLPPNMETNVPYSFT